MPDKEFILTLFVNELIDMPVTISYDPAGEFLRVVTCYNDGKTPAEAVRPIAAMRSDA